MTWRWAGWPYASAATVVAPPIPQHLAQQPEALREAGADENALRIGADAAGTGEIAGQGGAQSQAAARIVVAQGADRRGRQRGAEHFAAGEVAALVSLVVTVSAWNAIG